MKKGWPRGVVTERECPRCGYRILQTEISKMKFDLQCPHCHQRKMSEFTIAKMVPWEKR
jgi:DNA-directed RNA polymerase subunit RPC12/RpoP